ncbi:MAG: YcbK family protein [Eubacteriaceae bacterium]
MDMLEILRRRTGDRPVIVNSGYRCPSYNEKAGGVPGSYHLYGMAVDVRVPGIKPEDLIRHASDVGFLGLGLYRTFCHLDIRPSYTSWEG